MATRRYEDPNQNSQKKMKINEITLLTDDLNETSRFYSELMGFTISESTDSKITFEAGSSQLTFLHTNNQNCVYHFAFDIPHNKLNEAIQWLSARVDLIEFQGKSVIDFPNWNAKSLYFYDNNGNVLEFIARFENENESYNAFDGSSIVSISEIAFVTENVEKLAKNLIQTYDLTYYFRQIQREDFSVIGDDDGLIIIVDSARNWFPTPIKVEKFPVKVTIEKNGNNLELNYE
jgi:catechol 2,3-dioxygenase-like lactoylglutathione lyase family enzyme